MLSNTLNQIGTDHVYKMQKSSPTREHTNLLSIIRDTHLCITLLPWKSAVFHTTMNVTITSKLNNATKNTFDMDFMERDFDFKPANSDTDAP